MAQLDCVSPPSPRKRKSSIFIDIKNDLRSGLATSPQSPNSLAIPCKQEPSDAIPMSSEHHQTGRSICQILRAAGLSILTDSPNFENLGSFDFQGTVLTPPGLLASLKDPEIFYHAYAVSQKLVDVDMSKDAFDLVAEALDRILVELAIAIFDQTSGPHFTFIDPRYHDNSKEIIRRTRNLVRLFEQSSIDRSRIVVSIPSTEAGVRATRTLWKSDQIHVNLIMVCGLTHATICAEAGAAYLTFSLAALSKAYVVRGGRNLALESIQATIAYLNLHDLQTKVIVCDLQEVVQVRALLGVHHVCVNSDQAKPAQDLGQVIHKPLHISSSLPRRANLLAVHAQDPKYFLKSRREGGLDGKFLNYITGASRSLIFSIHTPGILDMEVTMDKLFEIIRDDVVKYRILSTRLATREHGLNTLKNLALSNLTSLIEEKEDFAKAYRQWSATMTGRMIESEIKVHFIPTDEDDKGNKLHKVQQREYHRDGFDLLVVRVPFRFASKKPPCESEQAPEPPVSSGPPVNIEWF